MPALLIGFGPSELLLILVIVVVLFGANRIPALMTGIGKGIRGLKRGLNEDENISVTPNERRVDSTSSTEDAPDLDVAEAEIVEKE